MQVFDASGALNRAGHDPELLAELIEIFLEDCPRRVAEIQEAISLADPLGLERSAHKLKGAATVFEARSVVELAEELESLGRQGDILSATELLSTLICQIGELTRALQESLAVER